MALTMDSLLKLPTKKKVVILLVILGVLTGVYYYLFFKPQQEELSRLGGELSTLKKQLDESIAIHRDLEKFKAQVAELNRELQVVRTQLPDEKEIPELLKNVSSLGKESNLEFLLFRPKPEEPQQFYAKVPVELTVVGNYHNTGIFFDKVSKLPRIVNVVDFNMTRAPKDTRGKTDAGNETLVRTACLLNTYRFLEKKSEEKKSEKKQAQPSEKSED
jgi:type IV pilus assembly protein PilO